MSSRAKNFFRAILLPLDYLMILLAAILAYFLRFRSFVTGIRPVIFELPFSEYLFIVLLSAIFWLLIFALSGLYSMKITRKIFEEIFRVISACTVSLMAIIIIMFFKQDLFSSRFIILAAWFFAIIFISLMRITVNFWQRSSFKKGRGLQKVVVIGDDRTTQEIVKELKHNYNLGYQVVGVWPNFDEKVISKSKKLFLNKNLDEIVQCDVSIPKNESLGIINFCNFNHLVFKYAADLLNMSASNIEINSIAGIPIIEIKRTRLDGWGRIIKRLFDIIFSFFGIVSLLPIFGIMAVVIKLDSAGNILYKSKRIGARNKKIIIYKFRSMMIGADKMKDNLMKHNLRNDGPLFKMKDDPRITKFGKFMRQTSLDELPQLFNVLKGDISLVGPRPHEPREVAQYKKHHRHLLDIKPGITGLAQISGRSDLVFEEEVKLDVYYIESWSIKLDLTILLRTPRVLFKKRKAE